MNHTDHALDLVVKKAPATAIQGATAKEEADEEGLRVGRALMAVPSALDLAPPRR